MVDVSKDLAASVFKTELLAHYLRLTFLIWIYVKKLLIIFKEDHESGSCLP
jgi:hypothetical protein